MLLHLTNHPCIHSLYSVRLSFFPPLTFGCSSAGTFTLTDSLIAFWLKMSRWEEEEEVKGEEDLWKLVSGEVWGQKRSSLKDFSCTFVLFMSDRLECDISFCCCCIFQIFHLYSHICWSHSNWHRSYWPTHCPLTTDMSHCHKTKLLSRVPGHSYRPGNWARNA